MHAPLINREHLKLWALAAVDSSLCICSVLWKPFLVNSASCSVSYELWAKIFTLNRSYSWCIPAEMSNWIEPQAWGWSTPPVWDTDWEWLRLLSRTVLLELIFVTRCALRMLMDTGAMSQRPCFPWSASLWLLWLMCPSISMGSDLPALLTGFLLGSLPWQWMVWLYSLAVPSLLISASWGIDSEYAIGLHC